MGRSDHGKLFPAMLLLAALSGGARAESPAAPLPPGPVISSVRFQVASPWMISYEELSALVTVRPGDVLSPESVRASIRGLYSRALFREVSALVREKDATAELLFFLRPYPVISDLEVSGAKRLSQAEILSASRLKRGAAVEERDLAEAEDGVRDFLVRKGFPAAMVTISASCGLDTGEGRVRIEVAEGSPAPVGEPRIEGAAWFPPEKIFEITGVEKGKPHDFRRFEEGLSRLQREYKLAGFLTAHVAGKVERCGSSPGAVCPEIRVEEGPEYEVRWEGPAAFSPDRLAEIGGLRGDEEISESALVHDLRERLIAHYRGGGYLRAEVSVTVGEPVSGRTPLTVSVAEGRRGFLREIRFSGNRGLGDKTLRGQMTSRGRGVLHWITGSGKYREEEWNDDLGAIIGLYQKSGYARMKIAGVDDSWDDGGGIVKTIRIEEGPRYRLRGIVFEGNDHFLRSELLALLRNREGGYLDYAGVEADQEGVAAHYRNAGYLDVSVEAEAVFDESGPVSDLRFRIAEGVRYRLGSVLVRGTLLTRTSAILRENPIPPGGTAGEGDLLRFQQAVYATGLFKSVRIQRVKRPAEGILDLVFEVEETLFFDVEFGAGYGTDTGVRGLVGAKERNLDGLGRSLSAQAIVSQKEQKFLGDLREPWILGNRWKWEGGLTGAYQKAERVSFSFRKASVVSSINRKILDRSSVSLQYELSQDKVFDVEPGAVLSPEDQGSATIGAVRGLMMLDFRDDPFHPRKGTLVSGSAEVATLPFGSEVDYYKVSGQTSFYFNVFRKSTFVASARAGVARPFGRTPEVPIQKRFFLGGRTTVRGFKEDSLGAKAQDGTPTGGDAMLNLNAELRLPAPYGFVAAMFADAGSVWFFRDPVNGFDLRKTAGLGLRYLTPVGPVGLDYGWKLDRRDGESAAEWHFTIGAVF